MTDRPHLPLGTLVAKWTKVAAEVECVYALTFDDYLNDVDLRHRIARRLRATTADTEIAASLALADDRFRAATNTTDSCVWGEANAIDEGWTAEREWYYFRVPKRRSENW